MSMYESKMNCIGKTSGRPVAGTALHGGDELPEPPLPCEAIGGSHNRKRILAGHA
jgi:hypothetical protein